MFSLLIAAAVVTSPVTKVTLPQDSVTAFVNVSVIPMDRERVLAGRTVLVQHGRIVALDKVSRVKIPSGAIRIDGQGKFLLPGLADMHAHLDPIALTTWDDIDSYTEEDSLSNERTLATYLASGVTTIRVMGGSRPLVALRDRVARGELLSPRISTAGPMIPEMKTPDDAKKIVAAQKAAGYDFLKMRIEGEPLALPVFDTFVAAANRAGLRWAGHSPWGIGLKDVLAGKPTSLEHLYGYLYTSRGGSGVQIMDNPEAMNVPEADLPAAAAATRRAGVWNCPTLGLMAKFVGDSSVLRQQFFIVKTLHDSGAGLLLGTDVEVPVRDELKALVAAGLTPYAALETGTRNVALFLNTLDSTGTVEVGKRADLVLLSANALVDVDNVAQPVGVMLGGRWLPRKVLEARVAASP